MFALQEQLSMVAELLKKERPGEWVEADDEEWDEDTEF